MNKNNPAPIIIQVALPLHYFFSVKWNSCKVKQHEVGRSYISQKHQHKSQCSGKPEHKQ